MSHALSVAWLTQIPVPGDGWILLRELAQIQWRFAVSLVAQRGGMA